VSTWPGPPRGAGTTCGGGAVVVVVVGLGAVLVPGADGREVAERIFDAVPTDAR